MATTKQKTEEAPILNQRDRELIENALMKRSELLQKLMDPRRDIDDECGYPKQLDVANYKTLYVRDPIAARVVELMPKECWATNPSVYEDENTEVETEFEQLLEQSLLTLRGDYSWYKDEDGGCLWEALYRADVLSGIGQFGVILLGFDDGKDLSEPLTFVHKFDPTKADQDEDDVLTNAGPEEEDVPPVDDAADMAEQDQEEETAPQVKKAKITFKPKRKLLYLRCFDEDLIEILDRERDPTSPRYGQPLHYNLTFNDWNNREKQNTGLGDDMTTRRVHWTRIIHVPCENVGSSELLGAPRMRAVWNRLYDLIKLYSGSAEMYWRGAFPGISLETHPQLGGDVNVDTAALRSSMEKYMNGLQRYFSLMGMTAKTLSPQVVDPTPQIKTQLEAICVYLECPMRIFMGSERGELASSQDDSTWTDRVGRRQNRHVTPRIVVPFIDRLIAVGVLPPPKEFYVVWDDLKVVSEAEKAAVGLQLTQALTAFISGNGETAMTMKDFFVRFLGMDDDVAEAIIKAAESQMPEDRFTPDPEQARQEQLQQQQDLGQQKIDAMKQGKMPVVDPSGAADGKPIPTGGGNTRPPILNRVRDLIRRNGG